MDIHINDVLKMKKKASLWKSGVAWCLPGGDGNFKCAVSAAAMS